MHRLLYDFPEIHILYENQVGFKKQTSTIHSLIQITEMVVLDVEYLDNLTKCSILSTFALSEYEYIQMHINRFTHVCACAHVCYRPVA